MPLAASAAMRGERPNGPKGPQSGRSSKMGIEITEEACRKMVETLFERKGYEVLEPGEGEYSGVVAVDGGTMVFTKVTMSGPGSDFPSDRPDRRSAERSAMAWLAAHEDMADAPMRFDRVDVVAVSGACKKGIARHTISVLSEL